MISRNGSYMLLFIHLQTFEIDSSMVKIYEEDVKMSGQNYVPSVIEPSFGIGRIMYCVLEHNFYSRAEVENVSADQEA